MDTIRMVDALSKFLKMKGIKSVKIHAPKKGFESQSRNQREMIIRDLNEGNARVLIGCNAIEEGLDLPEMDNAIFFSNFSSGSRKIIQRAGRTMRSLPGKEVSIYVLYARDTKEEKNLEGIKNILGVN
jgi:ERCC4-related helicase